jgi:arylsulfatase A-like enzyme
MTRIGKWSIGFIAAIVLIGALGYMNREAIALKAVSLYMDQRLQVGPFQEIVWETGTDPEGRAPGDRPPNIILILADDLGFNDLSFAGGGVAGGTMPTPNIDSIAAEGVTFTNGYAANGTCAPSRAAIMSGRYGTRFGFEFTPTPPGMMQLASLAPERLRETITYPDAEVIDFADMGMPTSEISIAELLADQNYHTTHIGKWHIGTTNGMAPLDQGFDESLLMASGLYLPVDHPDVVNSKQDFDPIDRFLWAAMRFAASWNGGKPFAPDRYLTDYYTEQAVKVIEANKDRPFLLRLGTVGTAHAATGPARRLRRAVPYRRSPGARLRRHDPQSGSRCGAGA